MRLDLVKYLLIVGFAMHLCLLASHVVRQCDHQVIADEFPSSTAHLIVGIALFRSTVTNATGDGISPVDDAQIDAKLQESVSRGDTSSPGKLDMEYFHSKYSRRVVNENYDHFANQSDTELRAKYGSPHKTPGCFEAARPSIVHVLIDRLNKSDDENKQILEAKLYDAADYEDENIDGDDLDGQTAHFGDDVDDRGRQENEMKSATTTLSRTSLSWQLKMDPDLLPIDDLHCKWRPLGDPFSGALDFTSSVQCFGHPGGPFERYCRFRNVCYRNMTIQFFKGAQDTSSDFIDDDFAIYPGVGMRRRNNVEFVRVEIMKSASARQRTWFERYKPCLVRKQSIFFSRTYNNFYFTTYTTFALHSTLKQFVRGYPADHTRDEVLLFLVDGDNVHDAAAGLFEVFSSTAVSRLRHLDEFTDTGVCFSDVVVGLHKNALLGEEIWHDPQHCTALLANEPANESEPSAREHFAEIGGQRERDWRNFLDEQSGLKKRSLTPEMAKLLPPECDSDHRKDVSQELLKDFSRFILHRHGLLTTLPATHSTMSGLHDTELDPIIITFISRRKKRRIINEREVVEALEEKWKPHVSVQWVNLEDFTFHEQLHLIRRSSVLIGMHGAGFVHTLWLHDTALAVEMFPFKYYKPTYQLVSSMLGRDRVVWQTTQFTESAAQWERLGPIGANLSSADKNELITTTHLSGASDAKIRNFLKNQDTYVVIDEVIQLIDNVMSTRFLRRL